jgi:antitoxin HicB
MDFVFPARLKATGGTVVVSFRDLSEAITEGRDRNDALAEAIDCLDTALLFRLKEDAPIPEPSRPVRGEILVPASPGVAAKIAFARAFAQSGLTRVALAKKLGVRETEIRRMLDPDHGTKLDRLDRAMRALGRRLVVTDRPADAA